jgi:peptide deformylase
MSDTRDTATVHEPEPVSPEGPPDDRLPELNQEARERRAAALAQIRTFGDPVLKSRASEITTFGPELEREAQRMIAIMHDAIGVGLAATQLGVMHRLLVFQAGLDATPTAIVNPELEWASADVATAEEGCLSLPRVSVDVERALYARVGGRDLGGEPFVVEASGLEARVLQHEIDHLDGVLMLDRTTRDQRKAALRALREGTVYGPARAEEDKPDDSSASPPGEAE